MQASLEAEHNNSSLNWKRKLMGINNQQATWESGPTKRIERLKRFSIILRRDEEDRGAICA
jgi:hypothetical protein